MLYFEHYVQTNSFPDPMLGVRQEAEREQATLLEASWFHEKWFYNAQVVWVVWFDLFLGCFPQQQQRLKCLHPIISLEKTMRIASILDHRMLSTLQKLVTYQRLSTNWQQQFASARLPKNVHRGARRDTVTLRAQNREKLGDFQHKKVTLFDLRWVQISSFKKLQAGCCRSSRMKENCTQHKYARSHDKVQSEMFLSFCLVGDPKRGRSSSLMYCRRAEVLLRRSWSTHRLTAHLQKQSITESPLVFLFPYRLCLFSGSMTSFRGAPTQWPSYCFNLWLPDSNIKSGCLGQCFLSPL